MIILHARITKTTHSGSVQFRLLVRTISRYSCQLVPTFVLVPPPFHPIAVPRVRQNPSLALIPIRPAAIAPLFFSRASKTEKLLLPRSRSISRNPMIPRRRYISPGARKFLLSLQRRSIRGAASLISSIREEIRERAARPTRYLAGVRWGRGCYIVAEAKEYRRGRGTLGYSR